MPTYPNLLRQSAVIPLRAGHVCLVTSRSGKRWVVPKGCLETGKTAGEVALQEAWEEAGLLGMLQSPEPIGSYVYEKDGFTCYVTVFLMQVLNTTDTFPESGLRQVCWLPLPQAAARIEDAGLRDLVRSVAVPKAG
jgi:8-oxo-dGTP pyrophosphatase MutT (NUDIX family)